MRIVNSVTVVEYLRQELPHCWSENKASVCAEPKKWTLHVSISVATRTIHHLLLFLPSVSFHTHLPNAPFHDVQQVTLVQHIHVQCFFCCSVRQPWAQNCVILWPRIHLQCFFCCSVRQPCTKSCYSMAKKSSCSFSFAALSDNHGHKIVLFCGQESACSVSFAALSDNHGHKIVLFYGQDTHRGHPLKGTQCEEASRTIALGVE